MKYLTPYLKQAEKRAERTILAKMDKDGDPVGNAIWYAADAAAAEIITELEEDKFTPLHRQLFVLKLISLSTFRVLNAPGFNPTREQNKIALAGTIEKILAKRFGYPTT